MASKGPPYEGYTAHLLWLLNHNATNEEQSKVNVGKFNQYIVEKEEIPYPRALTMKGKLRKAGYIDQKLVSGKEYRIWLTEKGKKAAREAKREVKSPQKVAAKQQSTKKMKKVHPPIEKKRATQKKRRNEREKEEVVKVQAKEMELAELEDLVTESAKVEERKVSEIEERRGQRLSQAEVKEKMPDGPYEGYQEALLWLGKRSAFGKEESEVLIGDLTHYIRTKEEEALSFREARKRVNALVESGLIVKELVKGGGYLVWLTEKGKRTLKKIKEVMNATKR